MDGSLFQTRDEINIRHLKCSGDIDVHNYAQLEQAILALDDGRRSIFVDLTESRYMDSTALAALVRCRRHLGERLKIVVGSAGSIRRIFDLTGLASSLGVVDNVETPGSSDDGSATGDSKTGVVV